MLKLLVRAVAVRTLNPNISKRGDVVAILDADQFVGRRPKESPWWRILILADVTHRKQVEYLLTPGQIVGARSHFRQWGLRLDEIEKEAERRCGHPLSSDDWINVSLAQIDLLKVERGMSFAHWGK